MLDGTLTLEEAEAAITLATRQYARRQRTWFRKEPGATQHETPEDAAQALEAALRALPAP